MLILSIWLVLLRMTIRTLVEGVKGEVKKHGCHVPRSMGAWVPTGATFRIVAL